MGFLIYSLNISGKTNRLESFFLGRRVTTVKIEDDKNSLILCPIDGPKAKNSPRQDSKGTVVGKKELMSGVYQQPIFHRKDHLYGGLLSIHFFDCRCLAPSLSTCYDGSERQARFLTSGHASRSQDKLVDPRGHWSFLKIKRSLGSRSFVCRNGQL